MKTKKIEVVIDRSKWRTGYCGKNRTGEGDIRLLNNEGYKCCLGFICGRLKKGIKDFFAPNELDYVVKDLSHKDIDGCIYDTDLTEKAIEINDNSDTTPQEKEKELKKLFKNSVYKLKFVGRFTKVKQSS